MPLELVRSSAAQSDLLEIWDYIAADSPGAADRMIDRFAATVAMLQEHPLAGRARPELADGLRSFACGNYVLFYRSTATALILVRVRSGFLDIEAIDFS